MELRLSGSTDVNVSLTVHIPQLHEITNLLREGVSKLSQLDDKISDLQTKVTDEDTVIDSAIALLQGIPQLIQDAINQALQNGATPEQLQALSDLATTITGKSTDLANAVAAGTPQPPPGP